MPFKDNPVPQELLFETQSEIKLREYQNQIMKEFYKRSHLSIFIPTGTGKTYIGIKAMTQLKPPYLIFTSKTLIDQWKTRIETLTQIKPEDYEIYTYQMGIRKSFDKEYSLVIFDECHRLPANEFSQLYRIKRHCTMGLSATPFREDGREDMIVALNGYPVTLGWDYMKNIGAIKLPDCHIWIVKTMEEKYKILDKQVKKNVKTFIYSDSIDLGKQIASRYNVPFVYGQTKDRMKIINESLVTVVSRVADEGISNEEIEQIIEMDWLGTSRRQSLQRVGRLTHNQQETVEKHHHIIMTINEWFADRRRIVILAEKGFNTFYHSDYRDEIESHARTEVKKQKPIRKVISEQSEQNESSERKEQNTIDIEKYPLLKYAGVIKIYNSLSNRSKRNLLFFIDPTNMDKQFSRENIMLNLGYTDITSIYRALEPLIEKKCIKKIGDKYQQNFSTMIQ